MFNDDRRSVDFVLAWLDGKQSNEILAQKRAFFEAHLQTEGLAIEREQTDKLHIVKVHVPKVVLRRYAEILRLRMPIKAVCNNLILASVFVNLVGSFCLLLGKLNHHIENNLSNKNIVQ